MNRGEKLKVYFKLNGRYYKLFNIIQMGANGTVDLKITDYYNNTVILPEHSQGNDKGYLTENDIDSSRVIHKAEMSYHKDGSFLHKFKDTEQAEYTNPHGKGDRWTPTSKIIDFQPIFEINIRRMAIYNVSCTTPTLKSKDSAYICENDDLFDNTGTYLIVCYIRHKEFPVNRFTTAQGYSDIITSLNDELDLCILIQRQNYPEPKPYYSKQSNCIITPYLNNSIYFCNKDFSKEDWMTRLRDSVFDPEFNEFLNLMTDGKFINLTHDKLELIEQIDLYQQSIEENLNISKPIFIKEALRYLGDDLTEFNKLPLQTKQQLIQQWNDELRDEIIR